MLKVEGGGNLCVSLVYLLGLGKGVVIIKGSGCRSG